MRSPRVPFGRWLVVPLLFLLLAGCSRPESSDGTGDPAKGSDASAAQTTGKGTKGKPASDAAEEEGPALEQTFHDDQGRIELKVPEGWEAMGYEGALVALISPQNGEEDFFRENLLVTHDTEFENLTFPRYLKALEVEVRNRYPDTETLESGEIEIAGEMAHFLVESFTSLKGPAKVYRVVILRGSTAYVLHATAPVQSFDRYRPIFEAIAKSVTFPEPKS